MSKDDGGYAFPGKHDRIHPLGYTTEEHPGMTLRDWFAGMVLSSCASDDWGRGKRHFKSLAEYCYQMADAMIEVRKE